MTTDSKAVIIALDFAEQAPALELADRLDPARCRLKVGKEMFTRFGADFVKALHEREFDVFLDLKFHDIPNTVAKACQAAADLGVWMLNVHASGGRAMMEHAMKGLEQYGHDRPLLIAVTVLTSMTQEQFNELGLSGSIEEQVKRLAKLTNDSGLDGVVCSAQEATALRSVVTEDFLLVTPGIRPAGSAKDDQHRIMTPVDALQAGSNYLVIGRPITKADDPLKALYDIADSVDSYLLKPS